MMIMIYGCKNALWEQQSGKHCANAHHKILQGTTTVFEWELKMAFIIYTEYTETIKLRCVRIKNRQMQNAIFQEREKTFSFSDFLFPNVGKIIMS